MKLVLEVTSGPSQGQQIQAKAGETVSIGRTPKASNPLADNFMSGAHFAVECDANGCRLRDLNSRNGTKLNNELVTEAVLKNGDQIHAGRTDFVVRIEAVPKSESVPAPAPLKPSEVATGAVAKKTSSPGKKSPKTKQSAPPVSESIRPREVKTERRQMTA